MTSTSASSLGRRSSWWDSKDRGGLGRGASIEGHPTPEGLSTGAVQALPWSLPAFFLLKGKGRKGEEAPTPWDERHPLAPAAFAHIRTLRAWFLGIISSLLGVSVSVGKYISLSLSQDSEE